MRRIDLPRMSVALGAFLFAWWGCFQFWTNVVQPAREAARRTQCKNNLYQHSGYHPGDWIVLDANDDVISIGGCPTCSRFEASVHYEDLNGAPINERSLPLEKFVRARSRLYAYKSRPRYREIYDRFNVGDTFDQIR